MNNSSDFIFADNLLMSNIQHYFEIPLVIDHGEGSYIVDADNRRILDFTSGGSTKLLGYRVPKIAHNCTDFPFLFGISKAQLNFADKLITKYPRAENESATVDLKVLFTASGFNANFAALELARTFTKRKKIVSFIGNFYSTCVTRNEVVGHNDDSTYEYHGALQDIYFLPHCGEGASDDDVDNCLYQLSRLDYETIAAIVIEPWQIAVGVGAISSKLIRKLQAICKAWDILLISDENRLAFYRTGPFFSIENYEIIPDLITTGKSLGDGIALGAVIGRAPILDAIKDHHISVVSGNCEACERGLALLEEVENVAFQGELINNERVLVESLESLHSLHPHIIDDISGKGMLRGIWINTHSLSETDEEACYKICYRCFELGLLVFRYFSNCIVIEPPLNVSEKEIKEAIVILETAISDYKAGMIDDSILKGIKHNNKDDDSETFE